MTAAVPGPQTTRLRSLGAAAGGCATRLEVPAGAPCPETFHLNLDRTCVVRVVTLRSGSSHSTAFPLVQAHRRKTPSAAQLAAWADVAFLRSQGWPDCDTSGNVVRIADLFSGCGAMSLGAWEACRAIGRRFEVVLAVDN